MSTPTEQDYQENRPRVYKWTDYDHNTGQIFDVEMVFVTISESEEDGVLVRTRQITSTINGAVFVEIKSTPSANWSGPITASVAEWWGA